MRKLIGLGIVSGLALALLSFPVATASAEAERELGPVLFKFGQAMQTGDLQAFAEVFWQDERLTVFWPDAQTAFRIDGWSQMERMLKGYSAMVSTLPPGVVHMELRQPSINVMEDVAIVTGYWVFTMPTRQGDMQVMQGRSTLVCKKIGGKWVIIHAHASIFPTP